MPLMLKVVYKGVAGWLKVSQFLLCSLTHPQPAAAFGCPHLVNTAGSCISCLQSK